MWRTYKVEGIVLKRVNLGETDKLITLFTKNHGKIKVLAKGIRKIQSKKAPHLELFTHSWAFIAKGRNFDLVTETQTINAFSFLRRDLERIAYAYRVVEVVDKLCPEREVHQDVYNLLLNILTNLNDKNLKNLQEPTHQFIIEILSLLGYLPKGSIIESSKLQVFLENIIERRLKSDSLFSIFRS